MKNSCWRWKKESEKRKASRVDAFVCCVFPLVLGSRPGGLKAGTLAWLNHQRLGSRKRQSENGLKLELLLERMAWLKRDGPKIGTLAILTLALREDTAGAGHCAFSSRAPPWRCAEHRPPAEER